MPAFGLLNRFAPWLDKFYPTMGLSEQERYRYRFLVAVLLAIVIYAFLLSIVGSVLALRPEGRQLLVGFCITTTVGIAVALLLLRLTGSQRLALHTFILTFVLALVAINSRLGGIYSPATPVCLFLPALASMILGLRGGLFWFLITIAIIFGFYGLDKAGIQFPNVMHAENHSLGISLSLLSTLLTLTMVILFYEFTVQKLNQKLQLEHDNYLFQANHDSLTGLANRRHFIETIDQHIALARDRDERFAMLFFDLNHFKEANDHYGHRFGDKILVEIARRLKRSARDSDTVARWGGDEFAVLLAGVNVEQVAINRIQALQATIRQPMTIDGTPYSIDASIGYALYPLHGLDHESLVHHADHEMYAIKRNNER